MFAACVRAGAAALAGLRASVLQVLATVEPGTHISLVSFDGVVNLHSLGGPEAGGAPRAACLGEGGSHAPMHSPAAWRRVCVRVVRGWGLLGGVARGLVGGLRKGVACIAGGCFAS